MSVEADAQRQAIQDSFDIRGSKVFFPEGFVPSGFWVTQGSEPIQLALSLAYGDMQRIQIEWEKTIKKCVDKDGNEDNKKILKAIEDGELPVNATKTTAEFFLTRFTHHLGTLSVTVRGQSRKEHISMKKATQPHIVGTNMDDGAVGKQSWASRLLHKKRSEPL